MLKLNRSVEATTFSNFNMHILQPKHTKLTEKEAEEFLKKYNIARAQLPKIFFSDSALPQGCVVGDLIKVERKDSETDGIVTYYRVVI